MNSALCLTELLGLCLSFTGYICCLVSLFIPQWLTFSSGMLVNESYLLGLWHICVSQDVGSSVCQEHGTLLELPLHIQMTRILVCLSVLTGTLGFMVSTPALTCVKCLDNSKHYVKRVISIVGGSLFILAGAMIFCPVSYFAHDVMQNFWDITLPKDFPRWEYGNAMFSGWVGGILFVAGGIILIISQIFINSESRLQRNQPIERNHASFQMEYV
ncbi:putative claudin-25 [Bombina bombina]|uniref:putative claudin-25 n=1 Tax=Bombina bombina TaxID=8345 RepID=UPI00235A4F8A|nr:putative claudin-25 [Bombina bombina]